MAIDTAAKRASVHAYSGQSASVCCRIEFGGSLDAADRSHVTERYRGIAAGTPAMPTLMALERTLFKRVFGRVWGRVN